jgi:flagellar biosynthesis/type III secretory pathway chaperone
MTSSSASNTASSELAGLLDRLASVLESMGGLSGDLAVAMQRKQRALVESRLAELEDLSSRETVLANQLARLERCRLEACTAVAACLGLPAGEVPLAHLLQHLPAESGGELARLDSLSGKLADNLLELTRLNADNSYLSANMLEYTRMVLQSLSMGDARPGYSSDGKVGSDAPRELLDFRV